MNLCGLLCSSHSRSPKSMSAASKPRSELVGARQSKKTKIEEVCKVLGVAGLPIAVIDQDEIIFQDSLGYRDLAKKEPVTSCTIFQITSFIKSFTGVCISQLRAQRKLTLDGLIQKHVPAAKSRDPVVAATATIADLLGHRTGLQKADNMWLGFKSELMLNRDQTTTAVSRLRSRTSLRSQFLYNNIGYATLGEIIIKFTGQPYHTYLKETHSTLNGGEPYNVPLPGSSAGMAMGSAGGLLSTANDLASPDEVTVCPGPARKNIVEANEKMDIFDNVAWLFAPLQVMDTPAFREKSYAAGWTRSQLPVTIGDLGVNPGLVEEIPLLADDINSRLALWHQGSLVGAISFVMILPETESAVLVFTNTMAFNDATDWVGQLIVWALLGSPVRHDYVNLPSVSTDRALKKYAEFSQKAEKRRISSGPDRVVSDYVGACIRFGGIFRINVVKSEDKFHILFQERGSQKLQL